MKYKSEMTVEEAEEFIVTALSRNTMGVVSNVVIRSLIAAEKAHGGWNLQKTWECQICPSLPFPKIAPFV